MCWCRVLVSCVGVVCWCRVLLSCVGVACWCRALVQHHIVARSDHLQINIWRFAIFTHKIVEIVIQRDMLVLSDLI